ncbi:DUF1697 domain-containing protein [Kineosporia sp. J2-2]|uniref:DUF1697 domain-containing protein n=1 Tax=Kineosporia corallincola TaxID=2835133 RepID=A0ABS5TJA9_9ACTN|nr:DUF1697 domain-containing protein [Kineosporia corallincola]MBT0771100.1 DUF1697 domain-containing protein [Kineosporia corallincola]
MPDQRVALLLRGINLGGRRKLAMAQLRDLLTSLGHTGVSTILASGQAVVTTPRDPAEVAAELESRLLGETGLTTDVLARTGAEMTSVLAGNPFPTADDDGSRHAVVFLRSPLSEAQLAGFDPAAYAPDELVARGRELYLRLPAGFADSRLSIAVGKVRGVPATTRNWNTVKKIQALTTA